MLAGFTKDRATYTATRAKCLVESKVCYVWYSEAKRPQRPCQAASSGGTPEAQGPTKALRVDERRGARECLLQCAAGPRSSSLLAEVVYLLLSPVDSGCNGSNPQARW